MKILLALSLLSTSVLSLAAAEKPNIVVIFIDDMGYADIAPFGATKQKTPNLDRMATEGIKLTSFYAAPVCSVSRAQLLTGCYGARISVPGVYHPASHSGLNPSERTIAECLKDEGYSTMAIGKWHLGDQAEFLPTRQGFDRYFGLPYSNDMQRVSTKTGKSVMPLLRDLGRFYEARCRGEAAAVAALPVQYADFSLWQREWLRGELFETQLAWWRAELAGLPDAANSGDVFARVV